MLSARRKQELQMMASTPRSAPRTAKRKSRVAEQKKAHQLFHSHHPWSRFRHQSQPRRLRGKEKIGRRHSGRDGEEHEKDRPARLSEGETKRGAEKRGGTGRGEDGCENALKERTGVALSRGPTENAAAGKLRQRNFENPKKIERKDQDYRAHQDHEVRDS